ncbi:MAG: type II toxin-antitoxin system PemK/MazF family toxin [Phaeodactylibacter sp.]|nr:type II toxin-antitoxin system PemK/MazF family toxin [Phaeodactylibacter sp.]MCB9266548.1 type II toxin-antitoxin system PemK/MazF family toxin [Lewinellaceae bacterium]MCB9288031.1 type II toxin-antitoxin system PemK/MazF family toxin [Lewinellaceae bacterium]
MHSGEIVLVDLVQSDGKTKRRPALLLRQMPPFNDWLLCGVSTQLHQEVAGFDIPLSSGQAYFKETGLLKDSIIRLGFLAVLPSRQIIGKIGTVPSEVISLALERLSLHLKP